MWSRSRYTRKTGTLGQRAGIVLRWPIGLLLISWRYLWRTTPVFRRDEEGGPEDLPPALPDGVDTRDVQGLADGYGPLLHRRYTVRVTGPRVGPEALVRRLAVHPNSAAPQDAAVFLLFSLVASGQIKLRRIDGWRKIAAVLSQHKAMAA